MKSGNGIYVVELSVPLAIELDADEWKRMTVPGFLRILAENLVDYFRQAGNDPDTVADLIDDWKLIRPSEDDA